MTFRHSTDIERGEYNFEGRVEDAHSILKMIISLSGPSKSGKTVLVQRILGENLIHIYGATIRMCDDLWSKVLDWMDAPDQVVEQEGSTNSLDGSTTASGGIGIPLVARGKAEVGIKTGHQGTTSTEKTFRRRGLSQVIREIAGSDFAVFVDDFHRGETLSCSATSLRVQSVRGRLDKGRCGAS